MGTIIEILGTTPSQEPVKGLELQRLAGLLLSSPCERPAPRGLQVVSNSPPAAPGFSWSVKRFGLQKQEPQNLNRFRV